LVLRILGISKSTFYDHVEEKGPSKKRGQPPPGYSFNLRGEKVNDEDIVELLKEYRQDVFFQVEGGAKVLAKYLRRDHSLLINHKKIARLNRLHGLALKRPEKKKTKFGNMSKNHKVTRENQVWEFDIKYGYLHGEKTFFFLLAFIDVFTRKLKGWYLGRQCQAKDLLSTLKVALETNHIVDEDNLILRSDNGPQMRAKLLRVQLEALPAEHEFIPIRTPNKNAHIESFFSIYDKHMQTQYFWTLKDAYHWTIEFMDFYSNERIHGSLGMSPKDFAQLTDLHSQEKFMQAI
jgi:putative transposase